MTPGVRIGGAPVVGLAAQDLPSAAPGLVSAQVLPGRGMMLLQAQIQWDGRTFDLLVAPEPEKAAQALNGGPDDFAGNRSFSFGGAILAPYANRIRGRSQQGRQEIEAIVDGRRARLPRNWGGKAPGAEQYAMHGLILQTPVSFAQPALDCVTSRLEAGDFGGRWPGRCALTVEWRLAGGGLSLTVVAENTGRDPMPIGIGWHPYFVLPSGRREQARLRLPARARAEVNNYDEVLPTGALLPVPGTPYDFARPDGEALGERYLDDCFTDLARTAGVMSAEIRDPAAGLGLRIVSPSPAIRAIQVYAPPDKGFIVLEPQFNLPDPFGPEWPTSVETGMVRLQPGECVTYVVQVQPFAIRRA